LCNGSFQRSEKYKYPLYKRPPDLIKENNKYGRKEKQTFVPHYDRKSIAAGMLDGKGLELLWVDCPVDAFFLHIQGSGRVRLEGGTYVGVGYDGANGHPYTAVGKILIDRGEIRKEDMSMQAIRDWIKKHPLEGQRLMEENASYVFFRILNSKGAVGAQGVPVSPGRTLAIDNRFIPYGIPVWLDVTHSQNGINIQRLMIAQDTGGAIKGPLRGDVFWGFGGVPARIAGEMKSKGRSYLLLPKRVSFAGCYKG
jgi:membrane-bound lytic murein transglycosylase A